MNLSFQRMFYSIATVIALVAILVLAKTILIPLSIALLMSFILYPLAKKFEAWNMNIILSSFLSILTVFIMIAGVIFFFSTQLIEISKQFTHFQDKIISTFADVTLFINKNLGFIPKLEKNELLDRIRDWFNESSGTLVNQTFQNTTAFISGLMVTVIFTFLFLLYRNGLKNAFVAFFPVEKHLRVLKMFHSIQQVGQKYLLGVFILTLVIGLANSFGLWIIGIENPFLFGFLGAIMSIIPYIGTVLGAVIPILYVFFTFDSFWMPVQVAILFWLVQLISDNFLSPKIVGGSLQINALTAILSLIIGGMLWGVAGMVLFLPFAAILKVICEEYEELKPIALLIGDHSENPKSEGDNFLSSGYKKVKGWFK